MHGVLLDTSNSGTQWGAIAVAVLTLIYVVFVRPMRKGRKDPLARKPMEGALAQQRAMERDMSALLVEYEQMMRTMSAQIETRVAKLELLIRDADQRLATLKQATDPELAVGSLSHPLPDAQSAPSDRDAELLPLLANGEPPRHDDVYTLADKGLSLRQIAQQLDRPYGEIELILALRPKPETPVPSHSKQQPVGNGGNEDAISADTIRREGELALAGVSHDPDSQAQHAKAATSRDDRGHPQRRKKRR